MNLHQVADKIPAPEAQLAVARAMVAMGSEAEWDSGTIECVVEAMAPAARASGLPSFVDQDAAAVEFWGNIAD